MCISMCGTELLDCELQEIYLQSELFQLSILKYNTEHDTCGNNI